MSNSLGFEMFRWRKFLSQQVLNGMQCIHGKECEDGSLVCIFEVERMGAGALTRLSTQPCGAPVSRNTVRTTEQSNLTALVCLRGSYGYSGLQVVELGCAAAPR